MKPRLDTFDSWLADAGPAALVLRQHLMPVEGTDGVVFPATFAGSEDGRFKGGYNIDDWGDGTNVCLIDSVGSQANRIEPIFASEPYAALVPQIFIQAGNRQVHLLEAGHRAGDALVRYSGLRQELEEAFQAVLRRDCEPLARLAPTSLVFGVWDSRGSQAKLPRLIASTIRAYNVKPLHRSAQFIPSVEYVEAGVLEAPGDEKTRKAYAEWGFSHVPASWSHGGVVAAGGIRRDATLSLAALRLASVAGNGDKKLALQRYVLGLALVALTYNPSGYLRQGCNLVLDPEKPAEFVAVHGDGRRVPTDLTHDAALEFAGAAAEAFGVAEGRTVDFKPDLAKQDVAGEEKPKKTAKKATKK